MSFTFFYIIAVFTIHLNIEIKAVKLQNAVQNVTRCGNLICLHNSLCSDDNKTCQCHRGYKGVICELDLDECNFGGDPCFHRGYCYNTIGSYGCNCEDGWENGKDIHCETPLLDEHRRKCVPGWMGDKCQHQCLDSTMCGQNQECKRHGRGNICLCKHGFSKICKTNENDCKRYRPGSYICECPVGMFGPSCSDDINECLANPCKNSGVCTNTNGSYSCTCDDGWTGNQCDEDIDECTNQPCNDSLICHNKSGSFSCDVPSTTKRVVLGELGVGEIMVISLGALLLLLLLICVVITTKNKCKNTSRKHKRDATVLPEKRNIPSQNFGAHSVVRGGFVYKQEKLAVQRQVLDF